LGRKGSQRRDFSDFERQAVGAGTEFANKAGICFGCLIFMWKEK